MATRHQPNSARSCELALRAAGAAQARPEGGPRASRRDVRGPALPLPELHVLRAGGRGPLPLCGGRGQSVAGDPSPSPQRTVLQPGFARCGPGTREPGGSPSASVRAVQGWALFLPQPPVFGAGGWVPPPFLRGRGGCGRGDPSPTSHRKVLRAGFERCRGGTRAPRGRRLVPQ